MSPEEIILEQTRKMNQGLMGFDSMKVPKTGNSFKDFVLQSLMQGGMGVGARVPMGAGTNPVSTTPLSAGDTLGVNRGPNMFNPVRHNFMGKPTNGNFTGIPSNSNTPVNSKSLDPTSIMTIKELKSLSNVKPAKEPLGKMYPADMYGTLPEANLNPGWRHPEMPEPFYGPNIAKGDKFDAALIQQQIKQKGYDPSKLTYDQMLKIMHDEKP